ncbi:MAG: response regulator [Spirochaetaceae bacterium]|jgi:putative two-component system response regulator|nr:response regulator [Spirochaetaceae bacterium]
MIEKASGEKPVVLVVDDMPMNLRIVKVFLDKQFTVITAKSGDDALGILKQRKIDLILLDIEMPGKSGFDVMEEIKKMPSKIGVPVICITGMDSTPEFITKVVHSGVQDYICKPFDQATLEHKVRKALGITDFVVLK